MQDGSDGLNPAQRHCVQKLQQVLDDALLGKVTTVAIISCGPTGFDCLTGGEQHGPTLYYAVGKLQHMIVSQNDTGATRQRSSIIPPGQLGPRPVRRG